MTTAPPRDGRLRRRIAVPLAVLGAVLLAAWVVLGGLPRRIEGGRVVVMLGDTASLDLQVLPFLALVGGGALAAAVAAWIGGVLQRYDRG